MKCQILIPRKNKKNILKCHLLKILPSMQSVKKNINLSSADFVQTANG